MGKQINFIADKESVDILASLPRTFNLSDYLRDCIHALKGKEIKNGVNDNERTTK